MDKQDPRMVSLLDDQGRLQDLLDSPGWKVVEGLVRTIQHQETQVLKTAREPQLLFQAQGVLLSFERLWSSMEQLRDATEDDLKQMIAEMAKEGN
jgi:hypothetical protein